MNDPTVDSTVNPTVVSATEPKRLRIAVIGRNVPATQILLQLRNELPRHEYFWLQTSKDARLTSSPTGWSMLPGGANPEIVSDGLAIPIRRCPLFLEGHRRVLIEDLGDARFRGVSSLHPEPIIRKILSLGLWGDLTPEQWLHEGDRHVPNTSWPQIPPESLRYWQSLKDMVIVPRARLLDHLAGSARAAGIHVEQDAKWVLGLQVGKNQQTNKLVLNAPNPSLEVDRVLWVSQIDAVNEESPNSSRNLKAIDREPRGHWQARGAWVEQKYVTALPAFSLWLDPARERYFLETGLHSSRLLKRVYAVPLKAHSQAFDDGEPQGFTNPVWLQIEELELGPRAWVPRFLRDEPAAEADATRPAASKPSARADEFLWKICPLLREATPAFEELPRVDESLFFERPHGDPRDLGHGVYEVYAGKGPVTKEFVKQMLTQLRIAQS